MKACGIHALDKTVPADCPYCLAANQTPADKIDNQTLIDLALRNPPPQEYFDRDEPNPFEGP